MTTLTDREKALYNFNKSVSVEYLRLILTYEPGTGNLLWKKRPISMFSGRANSKAYADWWNNRWAGGVAGSINKHGYLRVQIGKGVHLASRVAWAIHYGEWPDQEIDHINRIKTDNRLANLRLATRRQNVLNQGVSKANKSGVRGVSKEASSGYWVASIRLNGKHKNLGRFSDFSKAVAARKTAEAIREAATYD